MSKIVVAYYSATGNCQAMAEEIAKGAQAAGAEVDLVNIDQTSADEVSGYDVIALGCSSYGDEVLEEYEFQPFYDELEPALDGKKVALFGSYDWGNGEWMKDWEDNARNAGAQLVNDEGLIANLYPNEEALAKCFALGEALAK